MLGVKLIVLVHYERFRERTHRGLPFWTFAFELNHSTLPSFLAPEEAPPGENQRDRGWFIQNCRPE